jgi:hypothetical protein
MRWSCTLVLCLDNGTKQLFNDLLRKKQGWTPNITRKQVNRPQLIMSEDHKRSDPFEAMRMRCHSFAS